MDITVIIKIFSIGNTTLQKQLLKEIKIVLQPNDYHTFYAKFCALLFLHYLEIAYFICIQIYIYWFYCHLKTIIKNPESKATTKITRTKFIHQDLFMNMIRTYLLFLLVGSGCSPCLQKEKNKKRTGIHIGSGLPQLNKI